MCNKAIFLDRDGTINVEKHYLYKVEEFEFLPDVIEGLRILQNAGFLLFVLTNQSGIARGYYTEEDYHTVNNWMVDKLRNRGIRISKVYYCPHLPDATIVRFKQDCDCRKPKLGMFNQAIKDFDLDIGQCYAIGDKLRDCEICLHTSCKGFLIGNNESDDVLEKVRKGKYRNIMYLNNLRECADLIINKLLRGKSHASN